MTNDELERWIDRHAIDKEGQRIGTIADVYVDDATGEPEWLAVMTGLFGSRISFVPLAGAHEDGKDIRVVHEKSLVKDSPNIEADGQLSEDEEGRLYRHYGLTQSAVPTPNVDLSNAVSAEEGQQSGSTTVKAEVSAEVARTRLRRRDAMSVEALDLAAEDRADKK